VVDYLDISLTISPDLPCWPGSPRVELSRRRDMARGIRLIGVDYLSVQIFRGDPQTHIVLLQAGVVIVEGLNLAEVAPGSYELLCLPLKLASAEGAPARAVLRRLP